MTQTFSYNTLDERTNILSQNSGKFLIEERIQVDGKCLIFSDTKPTPPIMPPETITILKSDYEVLRQQLLQAQGVI